MGHPRYQQQQYPQYPQAGPQYGAQYPQAPEENMAKGPYVPAPYPAAAYQPHHQPTPGYAPGYAAGQPVQAHGKPPRHSSGCCNIQWVLFAFGWVTGLAWLVGLVLPLCNMQRMKASSYKIGWLANALMSAIAIAVGITMIYYWSDICDRNPSWSYRCQGYRS